MEARQLLATDVSFPGVDARLFQDAQVLEIYDRNDVDNPNDDALLQSFNVSEIDQEFQLSAKSIFVDSNLTLDGLSLTLQAPQLELIGATIDTRSPSGTDGAISLHALAEPSLLDVSVSEILVTNRSSSVTLSNATLYGGSVSISSIGETDTTWGDVGGFADDIANTIVGQLASVDQIQLSYLSPISGQAKLHNASTSITLTDSTIQSSGEVLIGAKAETDASINAIAVNGFDDQGFEILVAVGLGQASSSAKIDIDGSSSIIAEGDISITTDANTDATVVSKATGNSRASGNTVNAAFNLAMAFTEETSTIDVREDAQITSGGTVLIDARGQVVNDVKAATSIFQDGTGGLSAAVGVDNADIYAAVDGSITSGFAGSFGVEGIDSRQLLFRFNDIDPEQDLITLNFVPSHNPVRVGERVTFRADESQFGLGAGREYTVGWVSDPVNQGGGRAQQKVRLLSGDSVELDSDQVDTESVHTLSKRAIIDFDRDSVGSEAGTNDGLLNLPDLPDYVENFTYLGPDTEASPAADVIPGLDQNAEYDVVRFGNQIKLRRPGELQFVNFSQPAEGRHAFHYEHILQSFIPSQAVDNERNTIELGPNHGFETGDLVFYNTDAGRFTAREMVDFAGSMTESTSIGSIDLPDAPIQGLQDQMGYRVVVDPELPNLIGLVTSPLAALDVRTVDLNTDGVSTSTGYTLQRGIDEARGIAVNASFEARNAADAGIGLSDKEQPWPEVFAGASRGDVDNLIGGGMGFVEELRKASNQNSVQPAKQSSKTEANSDTSVELAGSVAVAYFNHVVEARIGANAKLESAADLIVQSTVTQATKLGAVSEANRQGTGDANKDKEFSAAIGVGVYQNDVQAVVDDNAEIDASYATVVEAQLEYPLLMSTVGDALNPFDIRDYGFAAYSDVLDGSAGLSQLFNVKTRSVVGNIDNDQLSVGAAVVVTDYTNNVVARIGNNVRVNQNLSSSNATSIRVHSELEADLIEVGQIAAMNLDLKGFAEAWIDSSIADPLDFASQLASPFGVKGDNAIGGVFIVTLATNTTVAEIGSRVEMARTYSVDVGALSDFHNLSLVQTGSKSTDFGFSASVSASNLKSDTRASISEETPILTRYLNVSADDVLDRISVAGSILQGKQTGIGASVGVNIVEQNVAAFIGRPKSEQDSSGTPAAITLNVFEASIAASSSGDIYSLVMAGALQGIGSNPSNGQGGTTTNARSRQTGPIALTVPVAVNEFTANTDAYIDQQNIYVASFSAGNIDVIAQAANDIQTNVIGASFAIQTGAGNNGKVNLAGSGAVAINTVDQNVSALLNDSELTTRNGDVSISFSAREMSSVEANAGGFSAGFSSSTQNRAGLSFGVSVAINDVSGNIRADLENSQLVLQEASTLAFLASSESQIDAFSVAGGASARAGAGSAGGTFGGAGAGAQNKVSKRIGTTVKQSTLTSGYGLVSFEAIDGTQVTADAGGVSLSVIVGGQRKAAGGIGIGIALNEIENEVTSLVQSSQIVQEQNRRPSADRFLVIASSNASVEALSVAASVGFAGGGGLSAALAGAGAGANNVVRNTTKALIDESTLQTRRGKSYVQATDNARINSVTIGASLAAAFSASDVGASGAIGLSIAQNEIDNDTLATVENSLARELFGGDLTIRATDNAAIESAAVAASVALAAGVRPSVAFSGGGAEAKNVIGGNTIAEAKNSEFTRNSSDLNYLRILADSTSKISSSVYGAYGAAGGSLGAAGSAAIGAAVSRNYIGYDLDENRLGAKTQASLRDSTTNVAILEIESDSTQTITSDVGVTSLAIAASAGPSLGAAGSGARAVNFIGRDVTSTIDNQPVEEGEQKVDVTGSVRLELDANDESTITANTNATSVALTVATAPTASLAVGVSLANNEISNLVQSSLTNTNASTNSNLEITATENATIDAQSKAVSVAASASTSVGLGISGAGASAINRVMNSTEAFVRDSDVSAGNFSREAKVAAADTSRINAEIGTTAVGAGVGTTGVGIAVGVALAENFIGDPARATGVSAFVEDSTMDLRGGALSIDALFDAHIDASVRSGAISAAVGSTAGSGAGAGSSAYNTVQQAVQAELVDSSIEDVRRDNTISVNAEDESTANANVEAVAVSASAGAYAGSISIGVAKATNDILNSVTSTMQSSQVDLLDGNLSVTASSTGRADTKANAAGAAVSTGVGLSGGGADAETTISTTTNASIQSSQLNVVGNVQVEAISTGESDSQTLAASVAAAPIAIAASGSVATSNVEPNVNASIAGSDITAVGLLTINSTASPDADATAASFALSTGLAVGVSSANVHLSGDVDANVDASGNSVEAGALQIHANLIPSDPSRALAYGSTGGTLLGVNATVANTHNTIDVNAGIADNTESQSAEPGSITVTGSTSIVADRATSQAADAFSVASGLVAVGVTKSTAVDGSPGQDSTVARIGSGVTLVTGALDVQADGNTENFANNLAGSGGAVSGAVAIPTTETYASTLTELADTAEVTVAGVASFNAEHQSDFDTSLLAASGGVLSGGGGDMSNLVQSDVMIRFGNSASIEAADIDARANNLVHKPDPVRTRGTGAGQLDATTGGAIAGVGAVSHTDLALATEVLVDDSATLTTTGKEPNLGIDLHALNTINATDRLTIRSAGVAAGGGVYSTINAFGNSAAITISENATVDSAGSFNASARGGGQVKIQSNVETYGGATVGAGSNTVTITPVNTVAVHPNATIRALSDVNLSAGTGTNFIHDEYRIDARLDAFSVSAIPIESLDASAAIFQQNEIVIGADTLIESGGDVRLHTDRYGDNTAEAKVKSVNWVEGVAGAIDGLLGQGGVEQFGGSSSSSAIGTVTNHGTIRTGLLSEKIFHVENIERTGVSEEGEDVYEVELSDSSTQDLEFTQVVSPITSDLDEALVEAEQNLIRYRENPQLESFYESEIERIQNELREQSLFAPPENVGDGVTLPPGYEERIERTSLTIAIEPFTARSGSIDVRAGWLSNAGNLEAPSDVNVEIVNDTPAFIDLKGIEIPYNNGGVYHNGQELAAASTTNPQLLVENTYTDADEANLPWPTITVSGTIENLNGHIELRNPSSSAGAITINAPVRGESQDIDAGIRGTTNINLPGVNTTFESATEHSRLTDFLKNDPDYGNGTFDGTVRVEDDGSNTNFTKYLEREPIEPSLYAGQIYISAEYINVNGIIQSGRDDFRLEIGQATVDEIEQLKADGTSGQVRLQSLRDEHFSAKYDFTSDRIVIDEVVAGGGYVELTGHIANTQNGQIRVLGGFANVTIDNQTTYDIEVNRIDVSRRGVGTVVINDKAKGNASLGTNNEPLITTYQQSADVVRKTTERDDELLDEELLWSQSDIDYEPRDGLRYGWTVSQLTGTRTTTTYGVAKWLGSIDALAADPDRTQIGPDVEELSAATPTEAGAYFFLDPGEPRYTYRASSHNLESDTDTTRWTTQSGWFLWAVTTYWTKHVVNDIDRDFHTHTLDASRPIDIQFLGNTEGTRETQEGGIDIQSTGDVYLAGDLINSGTTEILARLDEDALEPTSILLENPDIVVSGRVIDVQAWEDIGSESAPLQFDSADILRHDFVSNQPETPVWVSSSHRVLVADGHTAGGVPGAVYRFTGYRERVHQELVDLSAEDYSDRSRWNILTPSFWRGSNIEPEVRLYSVWEDTFAREVSGDIPSSSQIRARDVLELSAEGSIITEGTFSRISGATVSITSDNGEIDARVENSRSSAVVNAYAPSDITLGIGGNFRLGEILSGRFDGNDFVPGGDVTINATFSALGDGNLVEVTDTRALEAVTNDVWKDLQLTEEFGASDKKSERAAALETNRTSDYHEYWKYRNTQDDPSNYNAEHVVGLIGDERDFYIADFRRQGEAEGLAGSELDQYVADRIAELENERTVRYHDVLHPLVGELNAETYDPTFTYEATDNDAAEIEDSTKVWTLKELQETRGAIGFLAVTDTEFEIEEPNIRGKDVTINASSIGDNEKSLLIDLEAIRNGTASLTLEEQAVIASAEPNDLIYLSSEPVRALVTTYPETIALEEVLSSCEGIEPRCTWDTLGFEAGQQIHLETPTSDTTDRGDFIGVTQVLPWDDVNHFHLFVDRELEFSRDVEILIARAITDPEHFESAKYLRVLRRDDIDIENSGSVTAEARGNVYLGSEESLNLSHISAGTEEHPARVQIKATGELIDANESSDGATIRGERVVLESATNRIGSEEAPLRVEVAESGYLIARAKDEIVVEQETAGTQPTSFPINQIFSQQSFVKIDAAGSIADALDGDVTNIKASSIELRTNGSIGDQNNAIEVDLADDGTLTAISGADIFVDEVEGDLTYQQIESDGGTVYLNAPQGSFWKSPNHLDTIVADKLWLSARDAIGLKNHPNGDGYIDIDVNHFEAFTETGDIIVNSWFNEHTTLGGATHNTHNFEQGVNAGGRFELYSREVTVAEPVSGATSVFFRLNANPITVLPGVEIASDDWIDIRTASAADIQGEFKAAATRIGGDNNDNVLRVRPTAVTGDLSISGGEGADEIHGSDFADQIFGSGGDDSIFGYAGDDVIYGNDGVDRIDGGEGCDEIYGGNGIDEILNPDECDSYGTLHLEDYRALRRTMTDESYVGRLRMRPVQEDELTYRLVDNADGMLRLEDNLLYVADPQKIRENEGQTVSFTVEVDHIEGGTTRQTFDVDIDWYNIAEVDSLVVGDGTEQRSLIDQLQLTFLGPVDVAVDAFSVRHRGENTFVDTSFTLSTDARGNTVATIDFAGELTRGQGALTDGNYEFFIDPGKVIRSGDGGQYLDGDGDGRSGGVFQFGTDEADDFYAFFGDSNGDRFVTTPDFIDFRDSLGASPGDDNYNRLFDFNSDGYITTPDFIEFRRRLGQRFQFN